MRALSIFCLILVVIGAINWGLVGFFGYNLIYDMFGMGTMASRVIFALVGLCGIFALFMLIRLVESRDDICVPGHRGLLAR